MDGGILSSSDPGWLQWAFIALVGMFDWVLLRKSIRKTVIMVFHLCHSAGTQSEAVYEQRMTGAGLLYRERQLVRMQCSECGEEMLFGSLEVHIQKQHGKEEGGRRHWGTTASGREP